MCRATPGTDVPRPLGRMCRATPGTDVPRRPWDGCAAPPWDGCAAPSPWDGDTTPPLGRRTNWYLPRYVPGVAVLRSLPLAALCNPFGVNTGDGPLVLKSMLFGPREIGKYSPQSGNCTALHIPAVGFRKRRRGRIDGTVGLFGHGLQLTRNGRLIRHLDRDQQGIRRRFLLNGGTVEPMHRATAY